MKISDALANIEWKKSADKFTADTESLNQIERGCRLVTIWNHELSFQYHRNPALPFLQEMKASLFFVPACFAVGLYKPGASSMRSAVENALYFSYFCDHEVELRTLVSDKSFYLSKSKIIDYHILHTPFFKSKQDVFGLSSELDSWYREISAIIHGQIPGVWSSKSLKDTSHDDKSLKLALREFSRAIQIINYTFLLTTSSEVWDGMSSSARQFLLHGMSAARKTILNRPVI